MRPALVRGSLRGSSGPCGAEMVGVAVRGLMLSRCDGSADLFRGVIIFILWRYFLWYGIV